MVFNEQLNMSEPNQLLPQMPPGGGGGGGPANNLPLNNGTNNGAGRIGPLPSQPPVTVPPPPIVHNNATGPIKTTPNNPNRIGSGGPTQDNQKRQRGSRGGQQRNRNRTN